MTCVVPFVNASFAFLEISHGEKPESEIQQYMASEKNDHDKGESQQVAV
jgi:hypothetical protein